MNNQAISKAIFLADSPPQIRAKCYWVLSVIEVISITQEIWNQNILETDSGWVVGGGIHGGLFAMDGDGVGKNIIW